MSIQPVGRELPNTDQRNQAVKHGDHTYTRVPASHNSCQNICLIALAALAICGALIGGGIAVLASGAAAGAAGKIAGGIVMIVFGTLPFVASSLFKKSVCGDN